MRKTLHLLILILIFSTSTCFATTWDEPWADRVIKEASSFVLAKVVSCDAEKGISIQVIKTLSGIELKNSVVISDFYLLNLCSSSGHEGEFHTVVTDSCYFFITQNEKGKYCIATPSTGFDYVSDGSVMATFRHSYHQASVPVDIYEKTMTAVFNNYHNLPYDKVYIEQFVNKYLAKTPAGFSKNEINIFFLQHVALECIHHLRLQVDEKLVMPFLNDKNNFHSRVSAARALVAFNTPFSKQALLKRISDTSENHFVQVICVWTLGSFKPGELKKQLTDLEKNVSDESNSFGGNIMDPRVCTNIPSVKNALNTLISHM